MSVSSELLCSFELLKPLDSSALKSHIKKGRNKRANMLNSPVSRPPPSALTFPIDSLLACTGTIDGSKCMIGSTFSCVNLLLRYVRRKSRKEGIEVARNRVGDRKQATEDRRRYPKDGRKWSRAPERSKWKGIDRRIGSGTLVFEEQVAWVLSERMEDELSQCSNAHLNVDIATCLCWFY